jgi:hypothetical protein
MTCHQNLIELYVSPFRKLSFQSIKDFNSFTGDIDLPKQQCSNALVFFFDKVRHFFIIIFNFVEVTNKVFFALSGASRCGFVKTLF